MTSPLLAHSHRRSIPILERNCGCVFGFSGERLDEGVDEGFDGRGAFSAVLGSVDAARESERSVFVGERVETVEQDRGRPSEAEFSDVICHSDFDVANVGRRCIHSLDGFDKASPCKFGVGAAFE
jgi:hypothetical protein